MAESFLAQLRHSPEIQGLAKNAGAFVAARAAQGLGGPKGGAVQGAAEAVTKDKSPLFGGIKGALKGLVGKVGGSAKRPTNIYEQILIGVPVEQAYENWTQYSKFPEYMKGPEAVNEGESGDHGQSTQKWTAKIFVNRRSWTATVEEDWEDYRIRWSTEAAKGTIDGVVTFHPLADTLTAMVYVLEYRPKGFFERIGNLNRVVGRRARLDVKHFARYVMMQDQSEESDDEETEASETSDDPDPEPDGPAADDDQQGPSAVAAAQEPARVSRPPRTPRPPREPR